MANKKAYSCVLVKTDGAGITWITFNRPEKRNAMSQALHVEWRRFFTALRPTKTPRFTPHFLLGARRNKLKMAEANSRPIKILKERR